MKALHSIEITLNNIEEIKVGDRLWIDGMGHMGEGKVIEADDFNLTVAFEETEPGDGLFLSRKNLVGSHIHVTGV